MRHRHQGINAAFLAAGRGLGAQRVPGHVDVKGSGKGVVGEDLSVRPAANEACVPSPRIAEHMVQQAPILPGLPQRLDLSRHFAVQPHLATAGPAGDAHELRDHHGGELGRFPIVGDANGLGVAGRGGRHKLQGAEHGLALAVAGQWCKVGQGGEHKLMLSVIRHLKAQHGRLAIALVAHHAIGVQLVALLKAQCGLAGGGVKVAGVVDQPTLAAQEHLPLHHQRAGGAQLE